MSTTEISDARRNTTPLAGGPPIWQFIGPKPILNEAANFGGVEIPPPISSVTGRITAVAVSPKEGNYSGDSYYGQGIFRARCFCFQT
jgi:hypothetical protein